MDSNLELLKQVLRDFFRVNYIKHDEKTIEDFIKKFKHRYESGRPFMKVTYEIVNELHPDMLLDYEFYFEDHNDLPNEIIFLVWHSLNKYNLKATKRQVHELTYQANRMYYFWKYANQGKFNDVTCAVNAVIKLFREDKWHTPSGFLDYFDKYKKVIKLE